MMPACRAGEVLLVKGTGWWEGLRPSATVHGDGPGDDGDGGDRVRGGGGVLFVVAGVSTVALLVMVMEAVVFMVGVETTMLAEMVVVVLKVMMRGVVEGVVERCWW